MTAAAAAVEAPPRCPYTRHYSRLTGEYTIRLGHDDFTTIMHQVFDLWDRAGSADGKTADMFEALIDHIAALRKWTGEGHDA